MAEESVCEIFAKASRMYYPGCMENQQDRRPIQIDGAKQVKREILGVWGKSAFMEPDDLAKLFCKMNLAGSFAEGLSLVSRIDGEEFVFKERDIPLWSRKILKFNKIPEAPIYYVWTLKDELDLTKPWSFYT